MTDLRRRDLLAGTALALLQEKLAHGSVIAGQLPWRADGADAPTVVQPGPWKFFDSTEAAAVEALADRIIPPDPQTAGGKDAGCAVFIDRQLAGPYGEHAGFYVQGPFMKGMPSQGSQSTLRPSDLYRAGIAALERHCRSTHGAPNGRASAFAALSSAQQDDLLHGLESGQIKLPGVDGQTFFEQVVHDVQQGFFADPIYGGNKDMCAWKMIGFPGARYDYRDWVSRHNQRYPHPPVSIAGRPEWTPHER
jgi:gluconate 2-dehydrogenase gamma chain